MSKLIKRADGSYSKRGLWDNIRENKGSGKKPSIKMLKEAEKIKKEENMKMEYKKGGKKSIAKEAKREKESFMQESKELKFGAPGVTAPMEETSEKKMGGKKTMEPGGGGRFAKLVGKMKKEGKSEESAKAIAASVGRKKYGKSKFQEMAEAGKKQMGGKKC